MADKENSFEKDINVPHKEQIIIDGKGCRYKTWDKDCALTGDNHGDNMKPCKFIDEKNCYFKQLARKTQECEELKAYAQRQENQREEYYKEFLKKDKALEEIEAVCLEDTRTFADGTQVRYDSLDEILNIINKAKGRIDD